MVRSAKTMMLGVWCAVMLAVLMDMRPAAAQTVPPPCLDPIQCRTYLTVEGHRLPLYSSFTFDKPQPEVRRAVVMVHGMEGNAQSYYRTTIDAARTAGRIKDTVVIAPHFAEQRDNAFVDERDFSWSRGADWRAGDLSDRNHPPRVSSFELMSRLLARIADRTLFPNLDTIVLAGHSAGGQFVQRYAIGQPVEPALAHVTMRYIVANPGSYLYLDLNRPDPENPGNFAPFDRRKCQGNTFKYGFENPNAYFKEQSVDGMITRYRARSVVYLLGEADTNPDAENLSKTCAAMLQGDTRFARGKAFVAYMEALFWPNNHRMVTVPSVGHSARSMFQSSQGLKVLFAD